MRDSIIHIPTKSSSNEVKSFVVIFIPLHLTLDHVVEYSRDRIRLLDDLPNDTTLAQKIVASLIFSVTEILAIENHKLDDTFLHVVFGSQSLSKSTDDQIGSDIN
jgi:inner membrane protein involved in colicin E2 resistance